MNHFKKLSDLHRTFGYPPPENPLITVATCDGRCSSNEISYTSDFYMIGFKKMISGVIQYGKTKYDHDRGSMYFMKPRQIVQMRDIELEEDGFIIYFHEDFLNGHTLHDEIKKIWFLRI